MDRDIRVVDFEAPEVKSMTDSIISMAQSNHEMVALLKERNQELAQAIEKNSQEQKEATLSLTESIQELTHQYKDVEILRNDIHGVKEEVEEIDSRVKVLEDKRLVQETREEIKSKFLESFGKHWWKIILFFAMLAPVFVSVYNLVKAQN